MDNFQRVPADRTDDIYELGDNARMALMAGINKIADLVKETLGPDGRPVYMTLGRQSLVTKDGVSVARATSFREGRDNAAATLAKQVCEEVVEEAGDGTTTALVLAQAMVKIGMELIDKHGFNSVRVKQGIDQTVKTIVQILDKLKRPILLDGKVDEDLLRGVATISCNGDEELGKVISNAISTVGVHGFVDLVDSKTTKTYAEIRKGVQYPMGLKGSAFVFDEGGVSSTFENPYVLVANLQLQLSDPFDKIFKLCYDQQRPLVIIAYRVEGQIAEFIRLNNKSKKLKVAICNPPHHGAYRDEVMGDIATLTGATVITSVLPTDVISPAMLGVADRFKGEESKTSISGNDKAIKSVAYKERVDMLRKKMDTHKDWEDHSSYVKRYSQLTKGCAAIHIGARTPMELEEKKARVDDAYKACQTALRGGILPGGGFGLIPAVRMFESFCNSKGIEHYNSVAIEELHDSFRCEADDDTRMSESCGQFIVLEALLEPFKQILRNGGVEQPTTLLTAIAKDTAEFGMGYDARKKEVCDMFASGIIDPADVTIIALEKAASIAGLTLTIGGLLIKDSY